MLAQFDKVRLFHVRRELNNEADVLAKYATLLKIGILMENGEFPFTTIP
jgi:hypothetical protein